MPDPTTWPAAVLFDMDGTIVDSEPYWIDAEWDLVTQNGGTWSQEHAMNLVGNSLLDSGLYMREHGGVDLEPADIVEQLLERVTAKMQDAVPWRPGAREMLADLRAAGVRCALVTMSYRSFVEPVLAQLPSDTFEVVVTGDAVSHGKPHPEPYLKATRMLRVEPADCLAIEDSSTGTKSAEAAGCVVLVVPHHVPVLPSERRVFRDSLEGIGSDHLGGLLAEVGAGA